MKKILLIDGNSLMFRAYYATAIFNNFMQTKSGLYTNAIFGFANMIEKLLEQEQVTNIFVAFDADKKTKRHQEYEGYKGTRNKMPTELAIQLSLVREYLDARGIYHHECFDYEADDLLAMMKKLSYNDFDQIKIITGDRDLLQLVDDKTVVALTKKGVSELDEYTIKNFKEKLGITPEQLVDYKGLIGDDSDNLKGVSGVGPKTAIKLLEEYQTLENIIAHIDSLKGKLKESITRDQKQALMSKHLATLYSEGEELDLEKTAIITDDLKKLRDFFEKVEFNVLLKKIFVEDVTETSQELSQESFQEPFINDINKFTEKANLIDQKSIVFIELELDNENYHKANIQGISFLINNDGFYFNGDYLFTDKIKSFLENKEIHFATINSKKLFVSFAKMNIEFNSLIDDLGLMIYVIDPLSANEDPKIMIEKYINTNLPYKDLIYGKKSIHIDSITEEISKYSIQKLYYFKKIYHDLFSKMKSDNLIDLYTDIEIPLAKVLALMEISGMKLSIEKLDKLKEKYQEKIDILTKEIYDLAGEEFNISSPKQLGIILFEKLQLAKGKKNKTGFSTSKEILEELAKSFELPRKVLEYRKFMKLISTYIDGLKAEVSPEDKKLHTTIKQTLTLTGRLSSTEPNIQNIPIRTEAGKEIRSAFIPSDSTSFIVSADYSQIELRVLASEANCSEMINAFLNGVDLHASTASKIFNCSIDDVTKDMRRKAKAVNFGIVYGQTEWGLAEELGISPFEASDFIKKYFEIYTEIDVYLQKLVKFAKENGYSKTIFGRRRYMPDINSSNHNLRQFQERTAMNAPIQGSAADILKIAMIRVQRAIEKLQLNAKIIASVHDEIVIDTPQDEVDIVKNLLKEEMENAYTLTAPLRVEIEMGKNWNF